MLYVPILKCKQGEKDALFTLNASVKDKVVPLLEVTPDVMAKGSFCGVEDFWRDRPFFLDVSPELWEETSDDDYLGLLGKCNKDHAIPVIKLADSDELVTTLQKDSLNGVALRLFLEEILDDMFDTMFTERISELNLSQTDIIIDAQFIDPSKINEATFLIKGALDAIEGIESFRRVIFASNSFPNTMDVERYDLTTFPRVESKIYEKIKSHLNKLNVPLVYADYAVNHWSFFEFIVGIQPSFNIRYSTGDHYVVYKGDTNKKGGLKIDKVQVGCQKIVESPYYFGKDFSWGDNEINEKASGESTKSGNLTTWRSIGTNHHITFIVDLLSTQS
ncbi:beta family protein [Bacillus sp. ISL-45]|uniref:beta family protein n=1 Tax=Bacillus sp. ISL-45 TaxID=2819128 RepID=UPI001BEBCC34|nr:beta family protein [Bacillus sp. ISL-45]MBT2661905.1 beta family protein [Bacillus sp. ISL-45]